MAALRELTDEEAFALLYDWEFWARNDQKAPRGEWFMWFIQAGRGWGKTRACAEYVRGRVERGEWRRVALVNDTERDTRQVMVEGPAGLLAVSPPWFKAVYNPSKAQVVWPNGAMAIMYAAEAPDLLRGPEHDGAWIDEPAKWKNLRKPDAQGNTAFTNLLFGVRTGPDPRIVAGTTPTPSKWMKERQSEATTVITRGTSYDNRANLSPSYFETIIAPYEGTRLGRQEILGELLDDVPGALWQRQRIDETRVKVAPDLLRVVTGIDPAVTSADNSDETGIVAAGIGRDGHVYILADASGRHTPSQWAQRALMLHSTLKGDRIIGETNNGGDLIEATLRSVTGGKYVPFKKIHASRGKYTRAEPVASLWEQGRAHIVGSFTELEDQMCLPAEMLVDTRRGVLPISSIRRGDRVLTRRGWRPVAWAGQTGIARTLTLHTVDGRTLSGTPGHPVYVYGRGFIPFREVQTGDILYSCHVSHVIPTLISRANDITATVETATSRPAVLVGAICSTEASGRPRMAKFLQGGMFTTSMETGGITPLPTSKPYPAASINYDIHTQGLRLKAQRCGVPVRWHGGVQGNSERSIANTAAARSLHGAYRPVFAPITVSTVAAAGEPEPVYNLAVVGQHEFFANGLLVHNCSFVPGGGASPDRVDAMVWAVTELTGSHMPGTSVHGFKGIKATVAGE